MARFPFDRPDILRDIMRAQRAVDEVTRLGRVVPDAIANLNVRRGEIFALNGAMQREIQDHMARVSAFAVPQGLSAIPVLNALAGINPSIAALAQPSALERITAGWMARPELLGHVSTEIVARDAAMRASIDHVSQLAALSAAEALSRRVAWTGSSRRPSCLRELARGSRRISSTCPGSTTRGPPI